LSNDFITIQSSSPWNRRFKWRGSLPRWVETVENLPASRHAYDHALEINQSLIDLKLTKEELKSRLHDEGVVRGHRGAANPQNATFKSNLAASYYDLGDLNCCQLAKQFTRRRGRKACAARSSAFGRSQPIHEREAAAEFMPTDKEALIAFLRKRVSEIRG
jgi:hypothetical protein